MSDQPMYRNNPDDIEIRVRRLEQVLHNSMSMAEMTHRLERLGKDVEECDRKHQLKSYFDSCAADSRKALEQRLERLGNSVDELFGYRNSFIADHQEAGSRIEKMEKALSEEMAKTRELDDILAGVVKKVGHKSEAPENDGIERWCIGDPSNPIARWQFNTNLSPSGIPFSLAIEYLKLGRKVRRLSWDDTLRIEPRGYGAIGGIRRCYAASIDKGTYIAEANDLIATDWMVLPEKPQNP